MKNKKLKTILRFSLLFCFLALGIFIGTNEAKAGGATLYLSPSSGTYTVGNTFKVAVKVNSGGQNINAAEGTLIFNPNELQVISLSKTGSIFSLWTTEPTFSNSVGNIVFGGGTPSPFNGSSGTIFTITFKAKIPTTAQISFSAGSVLAADGKGTNVLGNMIGGQYILKPGVSIPPIKEIPVGAPSTPKISSPTHPDSNKWYSNNSPKFVWEVSSSVTAVKLLVGHLPQAIPTVFYPKPISEKQLENLEDGVWYFHVQLKDKTGWGRVGHFKFQIDTQPPKPFEIEVKEGKKTANPQPTLSFKTTDEMSGIDHYGIIIDGKGPIKTEKPEYKIPPQDLGKHTIIVKAVDEASNETLAMAEIEILPIEAPKITEYPHELTPGNLLSIKGTAIPEATVKVYLQKDKEEPKIGETKSDKEGKWVYIEVEPVEKGVYQVWAQAIDSFGAKSRFSEKVSVLVSPPVFIRIGKLAIDYLTTIVTLLILILAIIFVILLAWRKIREQKRKLKKEVSEAEKALYQAFKALKEETEEQVAKLDGRPGLSKREKKICDELKKALKISEKFIGKEVKDIEKELK